uniref:DUF1194 domain-containing protein n=1 Tax=Roseiarcus sp. TaxID=1969460 RepID=UPI003F95D675
MRCWRECRFGVVVALGLGATMGVGRAAALTVDAAVVLAADVSRSINEDEFVLERRGYAAAIQSGKLMDAISTGPHGAIALAYVEGGRKRAEDGRRLDRHSQAGRRKSLRRFPDGRAPLVCRTNGDR